ncbi:MAG: hypothetical protein R3F30_01705 [Planctomycetota bacterium]
MSRRSGGAPWALRRLWQKLRAVVTGGAPLCDRCKYDYGNVCTRPERPNAKVCPDFEKR